MWGRRVVYLAVLGLSFVYWCLHKQWLSWMVLMAVVWLPVLSLAVSLPAMITVKASLRCPPRVRMHVPARTALELRCRFPLPPVRCRIHLRNTLSGEKFVGWPGELIPTKHCGMVRIRYKRLWVYDYLGLFRLPKKQTMGCSCIIEPVQIPGEEPRPEEQKVTAWKPKPGGGFSENHDLRLYRPGDDLRQIHWKMSAKTCKLIYREPVEPARKNIILVLTLSGAPQVLDRKLGKLAWLSSRLLEQEKVHEIRCQCAQGLLCLEVNDEKSREEAVHRLLDSAVTEGEWNPEITDALWLCRIGGGADE